MEPCHTNVAVLLLLSLLAVCCSCESYRVQLNSVHVCMFMIGQCRFEYRTQPPSSTVHDCNPYNDNLDIRMSLECVVRRQINVTDDFEIRWFRQNTSGEVEDLGQGDPDEALSKDDWISRYHNKKLFRKQYNHSFAGKYWCQVINTTADPDQPLMRSNVFTLLPPDNYTAPTCFIQMKSPIQQEVNETCADLPAHSEQNTIFDTHLPHLGQK